MGLADYALSLPSDIHVDQEDETGHWLVTNRGKLVGRYGAPDTARQHAHLIAAWRVMEQCGWRRGASQDLAELQPTRAVYERTCAAMGVEAVSDEDAHQIWKRQHLLPRSKQTQSWAPGDKPDISVQDWLAEGRGYAIQWDKVAP